MHDVLANSLVEIPQNQFFDKEFVSIISLIVLACVHILCGKRTWWHFFETNGWVSFSAGASVAYVFIHVLPDISILQMNFSRLSNHPYSSQFLSQPLYLTALAGICVPYLLDTLELGYSDQDKKCHDQVHQGIFGLRKLLYTLYNMMLAYMIVNRHNESIWSMKIIVIVLSMHFIVLNAYLKEIYHELFNKYIRWFAATGLVFGGLIANTFTLPDYFIAYLFALMGGIITYTALKLELPRTHHSAPFHFLVGVVCFSLLILSVPYFGQGH